MFFYKVEQQLSLFNTICAIYFNIQTTNSINYNMKTIKINKIKMTLNFIKLRNLKVFDNMFCEKKSFN